MPEPLLGDGGRGPHAACVARHRREEVRPLERVERDVSACRHRRHPRHVAEERESRRAGQGGDDERCQRRLDPDPTYDHPLTTLPSEDRSDLGIFYPFVGHAWHIGVVEVDVETGKLTHLHYAAVHDAGTVVNPKTLDGQIIGGTIQGLGTAMFEEYRYDEEGRVRNDSFEYFHVPSSMDVPSMVIEHLETPSPYTPYGIKGAGEGGRMLTPAVLSAAIEDALAPYGVRVTTLPITPEQIVAWVAEAKASEGGAGRAAG